MNLPINVPFTRSFVASNLVIATDYLYRAFPWDARLFPLNEGYASYYHDERFPNVTSDIDLSTLLMNSYTIKDAVYTLGDVITSNLESDIGFTTYSIPYVKYAFNYVVNIAYNNSCYDEFSAISDFYNYNIYRWSSVFDQDFNVTLSPMPSTPVVFRECNSPLEYNTTVYLAIDGPSILSNVTDRFQEYYGHYRDLVTSMYYYHGYSVDWVRSDSTTVTTTTLKPTSSTTTLKSTSSTKTIKSTSSTKTIKPSPSKFVTSIIKRDVSLQAPDLTVKDFGSLDLYDGIKVSNFFSDLSSRDISTLQASRELAVELDRQCVILRKSNRIYDKNVARLSALIARLSIRLLANEGDTRFSGFIRVLGAVYATTAQQSVSDLIDKTQRDNNFKRAAAITKHYFDKRFIFSKNYEYMSVTKQIYENLKDNYPKVFDDDPDFNDPNLDHISYFGLVKKFYNIKVSKITQSYLSGDERSSIAQAKQLNDDITDISSVANDSDYLSDTDSTISMSDSIVSSSMYSFDSIDIDSIPPGVPSFMEGKTLSLLKGTRYIATASGILSRYINPIRYERFSEGDTSSDVDVLASLSDYEAFSSYCDSKSGMGPERRAVLMSKIASVCVRSIDSEDDKLPDVLHTFSSHYVRKFSPKPNSVYGKLIARAQSSASKNKSKLNRKPRSVVTRPKNVK